MNGTDAPLTVDMARYAEVLPVGTRLRDVISDKIIEIVPSMTFPSRATLILER